MGAVAVMIVKLIVGMVASVGKRVCNIVGIIVY